MRRAISYAEPATALAGEVNTWKFVYASAATLPRGTLLRFDLASSGRKIDWETPEVDLKCSKNVIYALLENGKVIPATAVDTPSSIVPQFEFLLPQEVKADASITICIGAPKGKDPRKCGNTSQLCIQRRRQFFLYIDPTGKRNFHNPEVFTVDIKGNALSTIRILATSVTSKNSRFDVVLRFEDQYGNLTNLAPDDTLIELNHENLRENLVWKLFVPETGFITLPNLYFNEPGVYTIELRNTNTKELFRSSPIKCFPQETKNIFWGLLHGESERFDATENIESCLRHFRDEKSLHFFATSPFESQEETPQDIWKHVSQNVEEFNEEERFTVLLGFQWVGDSPAEGVRQIVYAKGEKPLLRKKDQRANTLKKLYKLFSPKEILSIPSFTMAKGYAFDFEDWDSEFERVAEIYHAWGSSEQLHKEGNTRPIEGAPKVGVFETKEGALLQALKGGKRFGFVAGGLDDRGIYANFFENDQAQYSPGLTAIIATSLSRQTIFEALYNRSCYATTGERIIVGLSLAGLPMGAEIDTEKKPGLHVNRHIEGHVAGTDALVSVELLRNGEVIKCYTPQATFIDFTYDDMTPLSEVAISPQNGALPFVFYYLRVTQKNGHFAWSSPIWVTCHAEPKGLGHKRSVSKSDKGAASKNERRSTDQSKKTARVTKKKSGA